MTARPSATRTLLPPDATWNDYVAAHGGPSAYGWWIILTWYCHSPYPSPEAVGPYPTSNSAIGAMNRSMLINQITEDTKRPVVLENVHVLDHPDSIANICRTYAKHMILIDPLDPAWFESQV